MSRSNPVDFLRNPASAFISWNGSAEEGKGGFFSYYDKETESNVVIDINEFEFIALEWKLFSIRGFSKPLDAYCYSNDVRTNSDKIVVRNFKSEKTPAGIVIEGIYSELKGDEGRLQSSKKTQQLKFNRTVYLMWRGIMFGMHLSGKTFSDWMENIEKYGATKMMTHKIKVKEIHSGVNGDVEFTFATWQFGEKIDAEEGAAADQMDRDLQKYLKAYLEKNGSIADPSQADANADQGEEPKAGKPKADEWRLYKTGDIDLGRMTYVDITNRLSEMIEAGGRAEVENKDLYDYLVAASREYEVAGRTINDTLDKNGRKLMDYTEEELVEISAGLIAKRPHDPVRVKVEFALSEKVKARRAKEYEEDDIPF